MPNKHCIGIDLGTTNCCVSYIKEGEPRLLDLEPEGTGRKELMPSVIAQQRAGGGYLFGMLARNAKKPAYRYGFIKRYIGTDQGFQFSEGVLTAREISSLYLGYMKEQAEKQLGGPVAAVITVPAHFETLHVEETRRAAEAADLEVIEIIREPVAAAVAWLDHRARERADLDSQRDEKVLVFDLGGGTMDASVCVRSRGRIEVGANGSAFEGDKYLGGLDFDKALLKLAAQSGQLSLDARSERDSMHTQPWLWTLLRSAENVKKQLSKQDPVQWVEDLENPQSGDEIRIDFWVKRSEFEAEIAQPLARTLRCCENALKKHAKHRRTLSSKDVGDEARERAAIAEEARSLTAVLMVGGSTRVPAVAAALKGFLAQHDAAHVPIESYDVDHAVAIGAGLFAEHRLGETSTAQTSASGDVSIDWEFAPTARMSENLEVHPSLSGMVRGAGPGWTVRMECGSIAAEAKVDGGEFAFEEFPVAVGREQLRIFVRDRPGKLRGEFRYEIFRHGLAVDPGASLAKQISLRTKERKLTLLNEGTREGAGVAQRLLTTGNKIRLPIYEGSTEHRPIEFDCAFPPGTPVRILPSYHKGTITLRIELPGKTESATVELRGLSIVGEGLAGRACAALEQTQELLGTLPAEGRGNLQEEFELLRLDINTEIESPLPDHARIEDRLQQLEALQFAIRAFSNTLEGLRLFAQGITNYIRGAGRPDLAAKAQAIVEELEQAGPLASLDGIRARLKELIREMPMKDAVITPDEVKDLAKQLVARLKKVVQLSKDEATRKQASGYLSTVEGILGRGRRPEQQYRDLRDFGFQAVNDLYRTTVLAHDSRGLLSEITSPEA